MSQIIIMATIIIYLVAVVYIGVLCSKKNDAVDDFYLGGRKLGPFVTAMSAEASDMSSWLLMGLPGLAYLTGVADAAWTAIGLAIGTYVNWLIVAKRIRKYTHGYDAFTIPDFFSKRFGDDKKVLTLIAAVIIVVFFIPYTASGFSACGKLFNTLFGMDYHAAMILSAVIIIAYTSIGGFLAASTTDLLQSIIMSAALVMIVIFATISAGGIGAVIENAKSLPGYLSLNHTYDIIANSSKSYNIITIISTVAWGLGYFGMPHILLRFMAIEDSNKIKTSRRIASIWVVISMFIAILIGLIGKKMIVDGNISVFGSNPSNFSAESETVIMKIATLISEHGIVAALSAGLVFAGILACTMSTSDSQLLAASSSMSENILQGVFKIKMSPKVSMLTARGVLLIIAALSIVIAWNPESSVFHIVSFAWAGFGATFGPVMLCALLWKRSNKWGAIFGMITGGAMVFIWKFCVRPLGGKWDIYELLPGFIAALIVIIVVSLLTKAPDKEIVNEFEEVQNKLKNA